MVNPVKKAFDIVPGASGLSGAIKFVPVVGDIAQGIEQKDIAKKAAKQREAEAEESRRRLARQQEINVGAARARAGASGVRTTGSTAAFIEDLAQNYRSELDWIARSGEAAADAERARGDLAAGQSFQNAFSNALSLGMGAYDLGWFSGGSGAGGGTGLSRPSGEYALNYGPR